MRGADLLIETLKRAGTRRIFSLSGNQIMPIYDACLSAGMEIVHVRHEAAAVYMAEAHAQLTGEVGVALVSAGTAAANAIGPLIAAGESETPVLLLTGDSPAANDGRGAFQEVPQVAMTSPVTKLSLRPLAAGDIGSAAARALRVAASGRPGSVHIVLPVDVVEAEVQDGIGPPAEQAIVREARPAGEADLAALRDAIAGADRPLVITGPCLNATRFPDISGLSDVLDAPVITMESPRGLKDPSLGAVGAVMAETDLIVCLGKRIDFTLGLGQPAACGADTPWITVQASDADRDRGWRNLGERLALSIAADPRDVAAQLLAAGPGGDRRADWRRTAQGHLSERVAAPEARDTVTSPALCSAVAHAVAGDARAIVICDGGEFGQWAQAMVGAPRRILNGVSGTIGGAIPYAIAAAMADPDATVVALLGDGTAGFHLPEIETAARNGVAATFVIGNDRRWNAEYQIQVRRWGADRAFGCELSDARYDLAARALGGHGEFVTHPGALATAIESAMASGLPACLDVVIDGAAAPAVG